MRLMLFHQYFLGKDDPGGSRWNQFVKYFSSENEKMFIDIMAGNIHYATGKQVGESAWYNKEMVSQGVIVHRTWTYSGYNTNFIGRLIGYFSYMFSSFLRSLFLAKPDMIIVSSPSLFVGISALMLSKLKRIPFIFEVRDLWPESAISTGVLSNTILIKVLYMLEGLLYRHAVKIIVLTPAFEKNISERFPECSHKISIITNGADFDIALDLSSREKIRKEYGWEGKKVFAYFGAHGVANDLDQMVNIARVYCNNDKIVFALIGDGMQKKSLQRRADEYQLNNIQFIDSVPKSLVYDYMNASDICMAILKKTDTFKTVYPNKVFDYMRCKKPIIITIDGITRELVLEAKCGLYSPPEDQDALEKSINDFMHKSNLELEQMGEYGFTYVSKHFDRKRIASKYLTIVTKEINAARTV